MQERPTKRVGRLVRLAARAIAHRRGGEVRAMALLFELQGLIKFIGIFLLTVLVPGLALAYFGFISIQAEERSVWNEVTAQSETAAEGVSGRTEQIFAGFEGAVRQRLESGRSPVEGLPELSPYLRAAFRLTGDGELAAPFHPPLPRAVEDQSFYLTDPWREALLAEQPGGDPERAAALYQQAARQARGALSRGQAQFARGRALLKAGRAEEAEAIFALVISEYGELRDVHGFRLGDKASLKRGESQLTRDPELGAGSLQFLVEELLDQRWTIGLGGEAAIAARALELLEDQAPKDWLASARGQLEEQTSQLFWAGLLADDLEALAPKAGDLRVQSNDLRFTQLNDILWATVWWGEDFYIFALELEPLLGRIDALCAESSDEVIALHLVAPDAASAEEVLVRRTLIPWLPGWALVAAPQDAEGLRRAQRRKRTQRVTVIGLSLVMILTGAVLSAWLVSRELDVARIKGDFAANVSHELRSPITQIRLKGESLMLGLVFTDEDRQKHYEAIVRESERLSRLVDNVLDFAAIERGAKRYTFRPVDLGETVRAAVEASRYSMELRDIALELDLTDLPVVFHDPEAVGQVMHNLISNAAKYGKEGGWIGIRGQLVEAGVQLEVSDRGIGIPLEDQPHIFEQFYRSSDPRARRRKGTGIGLTIVKYIVEAHGGGISVDSKPAQGITFKIHFPLRPPGHQAGA